MVALWSHPILTQERSDLIGSLQSTTSGEREPFTAYRREGGREGGTGGKEGGGKEGGRKGERKGGTKEGRGEVGCEREEEEEKEGRERERESLHPVSLPHKSTYSESI